MHPLPLILLLTTPHADASQALGDNLYYFGDLHAHTGYSGDAGSLDLGVCRTTTGCGNFADVFDEARDNGMDFLALSDHVNGFRMMSSADWAVFYPTMLAGDDTANGFVVIPAGEVWSYEGSDSDPIGHKTLLMWEDNTTLAGLALEEVSPSADGMLTGCQDVWDWADTLSATYGAISLIPHHPATLMPSWTDWSCFDAGYSPAVEVYSRHGNSLEADTGWDVPGVGVVSSGYAAVALDPDEYGLQFGFVGGTDEHDTHPGQTCQLDVMQPTHLYGGGLTGVVLDAADTFDRMAIHDAIQAHRTYATSGPMAPVELTWTIDGDTIGGLGTDFSLTDDEEVGITVRMDEADVPFVDEVLLIGPHGDWALTSDGIDSWTGTVAAGDAPEWLYVRVEIDGGAYYGAAGCDDGGSDSIEYIWASPSFIEQIDDDLDDDGVDSDEGDCDDTDPTSYLGAAEIWYDGVDEACDGGSDFDQDGDGFEAASEGGDDCDDTDALVHPDAVEIWYDGVDGDCDLHWSDFDQDFDGYEALAEGGDDCEDTDAGVHPAATEVWYDGVDADCDEASDWDQDADGYELQSAGGEDCDDVDATVHPGVADSAVDGLDADCDGMDGVETSEGPSLEEVEEAAAVDTGTPAEATSEAGADAGSPVDTIAPEVEEDTDSVVVSPTSDTDTGTIVTATDTGTTDAGTTDSATAPATPDTGDTGDSETTSLTRGTTGLRGVPASGLHLWVRPTIRR